MPIYEFKCSACRKRTSVFVRSANSSVAPSCEHCGSSEVTRLFSRVAVLRGEDALGDGIDESSLGDIDENDPRSVARWVRKMSSQMGEPLDAEMEADLERMEAGEMPDDDMADEAEEDFAGVD